ncbi:MAG: hypothetical protein KJ592_04740 [Nanoarchaeota archaeon]|nr:hypothetical protein [Nanoarchaeota archaeon]
MAIKLSSKLTIASNIGTLLLAIIIIGKSLNTSYFNWFDYTVTFATLFLNIGINILTATGL